MCDNFVDVMVADFSTNISIESNLNIESQDPTMIIYDDYDYWREGLGYGMKFT